MFYFPQLTTGAVGQYPIQKQRLSRTLVNEAPDGTRFKLADAGATAVEWTLGFHTLNDVERDALVLLYDNVEGRLGSFTFLDPTDNLLCWSENLDEPVWERNSLLEVTTGVADPTGGTSANRLTNTGGAALVIQQNVNGPGGYQYAFSVQARSDLNQQITLIRSTDSASQSKVCEVGPEWQRLVLSGKFDGLDDSVAFGIQVESGGSVDLCQLQVEAQIGASGYKKTSSTCGVYSQARFMDDALTVTADGPNQHSCRIRIRTRV